MNLFDYVLLGILALSCIAGLRAGLVRVVVHLVATFAGLLAAFWCYRLVAVKLQPLISQPLAAEVVGFCLVFFGVMIVGSIGGTLVARFFQAIGLGWLDHLLGGAAGLLRGAFLIAIAVAVIMAFTPPPTPAFLSDSKILPYAASVSGALAELAPKQVRDGFVDQMNRLKQIWLLPPQPSKRVRSVAQAGPEGAPRAVVRSPDNKRVQGVAQAVGAVVRSPDNKKRRSIA